MIICDLASLSRIFDCLCCPSMGIASQSARVPTVVLGTAFVLLWCTGYPAARIALDHFAPFTLLTARFGGAGLVYAACALLSRAAWPSGRAAAHSAVVGSLTLALQFGALYLAVVLGVNVGMIALVIGTMPIVTAVLGLFLGERVQPLQWLGFAFGFTGVALAVSGGLGTAQRIGPGAFIAVACGLLAISVGTVYQKRFASDVDMRSGLALQHLVAAALLLPFAAYEGFRFDRSEASIASLGWVIGINSMAAFGLLFVLLRRGAVSQVAALFFLMPPVPALIDYVVLGDKLTPLKVAGIAAAALGVYLATRSRVTTVPRSHPSVSAPRPVAHRSCPAPCR
jgi:drug/metabolite transporter (DMT)-like permease